MLPFLAGASARQCGPSFIHAKPTTLTYLSIVTKPYRPKNISRNLVIYWLAFLITAIVSFFMSPFVVGQLGTTAYGAWALLGALLGYLALLDFGVRGTVTRYVAHRHATGDHKGSSEIASAGIVMFGLLGTIALLVSGVFAFLSPLLFNLPASLIADTQIILVVGGLTTAVTFVGAVFGGVVAGLERFDISSGIDIFVTVVRTIAVVVVLSAGYGLVSLALVHLGASIVSGVASWLAVRRLYPELRLSFRAPLMPHMRTILSFSVFLSALHFFTVLVYHSDALIIAVFLPVSSVTYFAIAGNLCDYARQVASAISMQMTPRVSAMTAIGSSDVGEEILRAARLATLLTAPIAITFFIRGESFINLWMGVEYGPVSGEILQVLALVVLLGGARLVATSSIIGVNKHRSILPFFALEAVSNIVLSAVLARPFGVVGVAIGTLIPSLIVNLGFIPRLLDKAIGIPARHFYLSAWLLPTVACIPFAAAIYFFEQYFAARNLAIFFVQVISMLPLVLAAAYVICLSESERIKVKTVIGKIAGLMLPANGKRKP